MNIIDVLNQIWTQILDVTSIFVMPDWGALIGLLPVFILLGVVGAVPDLPGARHRRSTTSASRGRRSPSRKARASPRSAPGGEPSSRSACPTAGATRSSTRRARSAASTCHDELAVICPMCGLGRMARIDTCSNCGLVLKVKPAGRRRPHDRRTRARRRARRLQLRNPPSEALTMAALSSSLFSLGVIFVALGFAAHVGHAVMLANGRRLLPSLAPARQPAYAGVVTGSFVDEQTRAAPSGLDDLRLAEPAVACRDRA